jgi:arginine deiminase
MAHIRIDSEIGKIEKVILHEPGQEIERMTPDNASDVLYDDILYLPRALTEHNQLEYALSQVCETYEMLNLLQDVLDQPEARQHILSDLRTSINVPERNIRELQEMGSRSLAFQLIIGSVRIDTTLENFLNPDHYAIPPLPNFFFMRDAAMCVNDKVITGMMANRIRVAESIIMKHLFIYHPALQGGGFYYDGTNEDSADLTIEGGDILILSKEVVLIGLSERTSISGIDKLVSRFAKSDFIKHVIVLQIPKHRATIHLDMIFTMVDVDKCVVFPPLITGPNACHSIHIEIENNSVKSISNCGDLLGALKKVGFDLEPIPCGGSNLLHQEREQWTSGANFFTLAPGKIVGYGRNVRTFEELDKRGFEIVRIPDLKSGAKNINDFERVAVSIEGAELSRGGGGCRCMTLPIKRADVAFK